MTLPWKPILRTLSVHALLGALVVAGVAGIEGAVLGYPDEPSVVLPLVGALGGGVWTGALIGACIGLVLCLFSPLLQRWWWPQWRLWTDNNTTPRPDTTPNIPTPPGPMTAAVNVHARVVATLISLTLGIATFTVVAGVAPRIKEEALRVVFMNGGAAVSSLVTVIATLASTPLLRRAFHWLEARVGLPFPRPALLRYFLFVLLPVTALILPLFFRFGVALGILSRLFGAILYLTLHLGAYLLHSRLQKGKGPRYRRSLHVLVTVPLLGLALAGPWLFQYRPSKTAPATNNPIAAVAINLLQSASDVDRDGISSLFGGTDCAPWDSSVSPAAREVPSNGKDENCDGLDGKAVERRASATHTFSGKLPPHQVKNYNILWYIVDSLRTDHLPLYGYPKRTAPFLSTLSKESWVFNQAYSQSSNTSLSVPSMFSGRWPASLSWSRGVYPVASRDEHYLSKTLTKRGYHTGILLNDWVKKRLPALGYGFTKIYVAPPKVNWKSANYALSNIALGVADAQQSKRPFFLAVHIDDVHHPYRSSLGRPFPRFHSKQQNVSNYDRGIALFDEHLRTTVAHLKNAGQWHNTIIVVTADHGEEFREHGGAIHSTSCYTEVTHVPLLLRIPGLGAKRLNQPVALTDLVPTLLELTGATPEGPLEGQSLLVPALAPHLAEPERPIYCSIMQLLSGRKPFFTRAVRQGSFSMMHELLSDRVELYDIRKDPKEQHNLAGAPGTQQTVSELQALLRQSLTGNLFELRLGNAGR